MHFCLKLFLFVASSYERHRGKKASPYRWTFRVLVLRDAPLVAAGPYRLIHHPNYVAVIGELVGVAATVWAPITGVLVTIGFGLLLRARIRVEDRALGRLQ